MLRLAVMGAVDSGKTTFVNLYVKKLEKYGRTQSLSLLQGNLKGLEVQFIDCPGHSALSYAKNVSLTLADAVIYIVDTQNPNFDLLNQISNHRPVLVLFNRWPGIEPLKDYFGTEKEAILYSQLVEKCKNLNIEFLPFFDQSKSKFFTFPINFLSGWGVSEFETYLKKRWIGMIKPLHRDYMYLVDDRIDYKYQSTSNHDASTHINQIFSDVLTFFKYNPVSKIYTLKPEFNQFFKPVYILNQDTSHPPIIELSYTNSTSKEISDLLNRAKVLDLKVFLFADTPHKLNTLLQFFNTHGVKVSVCNNFNFNQFKNMKEPNLKIAWVEVNKDTVEYEGVFYSDSYYKLEGYIKKYLQLRLQDYISEQIKNIKKEFIVELLPEYVFKREKGKFILGAKLLVGVLSSNTLVNFNDGREGYIQSIQYEKKKKSSWDNLEKNVSLELTVDPTWTPEDGLCKVYSSTLIQTLNRYKDTLEPEINNLCTYYRNELK